MAFNLFGSKSKLGIDIGTSSIKVVELSKEGGRWKLDNYGMYELRSQSGSADSAKTVMDLPDAEIVTALQNILKTSGIKSRDAVAAVSSFSTFATVIEMPYVSEEDLAKTIPFEARKYIPVPLDQVVLDWSIIGVVDGKGGIAPVPAGPTPVGTTVTVEVFLAAVPKDETARYQRIMKAAGINLLALELENSSLVRALLGNDLSPTAILNVGGRSTSIVIVSKGYERLGHNYEIGGYEMTKAIANSLTITPDQAEGLKRKYGVIDSPENRARAAIMPLVDMMVFEANQTIESFERSHNQSGAPSVGRIGRVVLIGGMANMPGLAQYIKQRIPRDVLVGNIFARLIYPPELTPLIQTLSNGLAVAVGCAMRET